MEGSPPWRGKPGIASWRRWDLIWTLKTGCSLELEGKTFLPRSKRLLISWLQSPSAVILEPRKIKSDIVSIVSPSISHEVMGPDAMILVF